MQWVSGAPKVWLTGLSCTQKIEQGLEHLGWACGVLAAQCLQSLADAYPKLGLCCIQGIL